MFVACPSDNAVKLALKLSMFDAKIHRQTKITRFVFNPSSLVGSHLRLQYPLWFINTKVLVLDEVLNIFPLGCVNHLTLTFNHQKSDASHKLKPPLNRRNPTFLICFTA